TVSAARLALEVGMVDEGGLGPPRCRTGPIDRHAVRAEHADYLPEVLQRLAGTVPDHPGGPGDLLGYGVGTQLQRPGVQAQQGQAVGEHIVHLPGDRLRSDWRIWATRSSCSDSI